MVAHARRPRAPPSPPPRPRLGRLVARAWRHRVLPLLPLPRLSPPPRPLLSPPPRPGKWFPLLALTQWPPPWLWDWLVRLVTAWAGTALVSRAFREERGKYNPPQNFENQQIDTGRRFAAALLPRLFGTNPRSHYKGATGRVRTGNRRLPVLCHCQLGQDIQLRYLQNLKKYEVLWTYKNIIWISVFWIFTLFIDICLKKYRI